MAQTLSKYSVSADLLSMLTCRIWDKSLTTSIRQTLSVKRKPLRSLSTVFPIHYLRNCTSRAASETRACIACPPALTAVSRLDCICLWQE